MIVANVNDDEKSEMTAIAYRLTTALLEACGVLPDVTADPISAALADAFVLGVKCCGRNVRENAGL